MKPLTVLVCCALLGVASTACGPGTSAPDPGVRTESAPAVDFDTLAILVSGRAEVLPEAARLLASQGQPLPTLAGRTLSIEEPLRVLVHDEAARLGSASLAEDGGFLVPEVPVREVHLGLSASLAHEGLAPTATLFFDTALTGTRPRTDVIDARAWAVPLGFHDTLSRAVGEPRLRTLSDGRAATLLEAGFVLGRVVDAQGRPLAGARVVTQPGALAGRVFYPSEDLLSVGQQATASSGLFLLVHSGAGAESFLLGVEGAEGYPWRNAGASPGLGLVLTLHPGLYAP